MFLKKIPSILTKGVKDITWHLSREERSVYLSFDDGPDPASTPPLLELLDRYEAKATFFCLSEKAKQHPELIELIREKGHQVGAHGFAHLDGWKTKDEAYLENARRSLDFLKTDLFRPPYGRISPSQLKILKKECRVILWDVMPGDFDEKLSAKQCSRSLEKNAQSGSIIVLHDRADFWEKLEEILKQSLPALKDKFRLKALKL